MCQYYAIESAAVTLREKITALRAVDPTLERMCRLLRDWSESSPQMTNLYYRPDKVPRDPGVYLMIIDAPVDYPTGRSSVVYIGEAHGPGGLAARLRTHYYGIRSVEKTQEILHPRYEWVANRGGFCIWAAAPDGPDGARAMESRLIHDFLRAHWATPHANWRRERYTPPASPGVRRQQLRHKSKI